MLSHQPSRKIDRYIYIFLYALPLFYLDLYGILLFVSALSIIELIPGFGSSSTEINQKAKNLRYLIISVIFLIISFGLTYLFDHNYLDQGLTISKIKLIPTYIIFFYLLVPILWGFQNKQLRSFFNLNKNIVRYSLLICIPVIIVNLIDVIKTNAIHSASTHILIQSIFQAVFTAALAEELFFRGFIYNLFKKFLSINSAQIISAILFGLWHLKLFYGIFASGFSLYPFLNLIAICLLGLANAKLFEKTGSLIPCIIFHSLINGAFKNIALLLLALI